MNYRFLLLFLFCALSLGVFAQPLPCPPLTTTWIQGLGDTTVCNGACTPISCEDSTSVRSTSSYSYSTIPYLPTAFTGGTPILVGIDDIYSDAIDIPFPFCFYGNKYNQCLIGANGEICFNLSLAGGYCPWSISGPIPTTSSELNDGTLNSIMGVYEDIDPGWGGIINWAVYGTAPCRTFVVSWSQVPYFNTGGGLCVPDTNTQQIVLYESTYAIDIFVKHKPACTAWNSGWGILGICDATGANYNIPAAYNATVFTMDTSGFRFTPNAPANWYYTWTDNTGAVVGTAQTVTVCPTDSTTYTVKGIATSNCDSYTVYSTVFVNVGKDPTVDNITVTNPTLCNQNNGSIVLHGLVPGISDTIYYDYNGVAQPYYVQTSAADSTITLTNLCQGIYSEIIVKVGGCHTPPYTAVLTPPALNIGISSTTYPTFCGLCDGTITVNDLVAGAAYTLNYDYANSYTVTPVAQPALTFTASPSGTYTLTGLCAGIYDNINATLTSGSCALSCVTTNIGPDTLFVPSTPNVDIIAATPNTLCGICDGTITLKGTSPFSFDTVNYLFNGTAAPTFVTIGSDSTIKFVGLCQGTYSGITVKFGACSVNVPGSAFIDSVTIQSLFDTSIHLGCNGDTVFFKNNSSSYLAGTPIITSPLYYSWNFGDGTSDSSSSPYHIFQNQGTYTVSLVADDHLCWDTLPVTITLYHPLLDSFAASSYNVCQGAPVLFTNYSSGTPDSALSYNWYFGDGSTSTLADPSYNFPQSGTYSVTLVASDYVPCYDTFTAVVQIDTLSNINVLASDTTICQGTDITFTGLYAALGNTGITWYPGDGDSVLNVNPLTYAYNTIGNFTFTAIAYYRACANATNTHNINVIATPIINLGPDTSICAGSGAITLADNINGGKGGSWLWSTGQTTAAISVNTAGTYYATVSINNCSASDSVVVTNDCYMDIPNAFTPNNDGANDYFYPRQLLTKGLTTFKMDIYNRWGQLIFETTSLDGSGWDGKFNGVDQPTGVFVYVIDATFKDGQKEHHQGNVTLLR